MGNCLCHHSSVQIVGQNHGEPANDRNFCSKTCCDSCDMAMNLVKSSSMNEEEMMDGDSVTSSITTATRGHEVKIKITKKQLEELLYRVDIKELTVQQVLVQLMNVSGDDHQTNQRSWRPALQSIPE